MVEEGTTPADEARSSSQPRVVKKVVKKTVVRPVAPSAPAPREARPAPPRATAVSRLKGKDTASPPSRRSGRPSSPGWWPVCW